MFMSCLPHIVAVVPNSVPEYEQSQHAKKNDYPSRNISFSDTANTTAFPRSAQPATLLQFDGDALVRATVMRASYG
jgi:hypothetical protein